MRHLAATIKGMRVLTLLLFKSMSFIFYCECNYRELILIKMIANLIFVISVVFSNITLANDKSLMACSAIASYIAEKYDYEGDDHEFKKWEARSTSHWVSLGRSNRITDTAKEYFVSYSLSLSRQYDEKADDDIYDVISELSGKWLFYCR